MDKDTLERLLIGFVIGAVLGALLSLGAEALLNLILASLDMPVQAFHWWSLLPAAIFIGLAMAAVMFRPPFGLND